MRSLPIAAVLVWCTWGCGSSPVAPSPGQQNPPGPAPPPAPGAPATTHRFIGTVMNEEGSPLQDALVVLTYVPDIGATQTTSAYRSRPDASRAGAPRPSPA